MSLISSSGSVIKYGDYGLNKFNVFEMNESMSDKFIEEKMKFLHNEVLKSMDNTPDIIDASLLHEWKVIPQNGSEPEKHKYKLLSLFIVENYLPVINEFFDNFFQLRSLVNDLKGNRYFKIFYTESFYLFDFDRINSEEALAYYFLFRSKIEQFSTQDLVVLQEGSYSTDPEVSEVARCVLLASQYQEMQKKIRKNYRSVQHLKLTSEFFKRFADGTDRIPDFGSQISIDLLNMFLKFYREFVQRRIKRVVDLFETHNYPTSTELDGMIKGLELWRAESVQRKESYIASYDRLMKLARSMRVSREFVKENINFKIVVNGEEYTTIQFYQLCKAKPQEEITSEVSFDDIALEKVRQYKPALRKRGKKAKGRSRPTRKEPMIIAPIVKPAELKSELKESIAIVYAERVTRWFQKEPEVLTQEESYRNLPLVQKRLQHLFHGFTRVVDQFLENYSFKTVWENRASGNEDKLFCIPGEVRLEDRKIYGLFSYCFGSDNTCYHRYFSIRSKREFFQYAENPVFNEGVEAVQEREIGEEMVVTEKLKFKIDKKAEVTVNNATELVTIVDPKHHAMIYLFKPAVV